MQLGHDEVVSCGRGAGVRQVRAWGWAVGLAVLLAPFDGLTAQQVVTQPTRVITIARGGSALIQTPDNITRLSVADPEVADADNVSPREVLVRGVSVGTTSVLTWDRFERATIYSVVVTPDIGALQRQIEVLFPGVSVTLTASGNAIIVSGIVRDPHVARRILEVIETSGVTIINNMQAPSARQVLLHVRFAEVNRSAMSAFNSDLRLINPQDYGGLFDNPLVDIETFAEGAVRLFLLGDNGSAFEALIRAMRSQGLFKSLAEPNLVALEGQQATFLAGGEFPFPTVQSGQSNAVTIQWKEFGIRLNFVPFVTNIGTIRLQVAPEVSALDFANGLTFGGFQVPALLTRRAETSIELRPGQHLAIAGLLDNATLTEWQKIPLLGDLPIIGNLFRSRSMRDRNTELLVIVTPHLVEPVDAPIPTPTGEPETWQRRNFMHERTLQLPAGVRIIPPAPAPAPGGN